jgi:hypothetical protein
MHFIRDGKVTFQAKTGASNAAYLVGDTIPVEEYTSLSSATTLPLDQDLWHCRLCHSHLAGIKKLLSGNLVTGFKLDSQENPDPVCEACKAGKMHADPFPNSTSRASKPLQLIHSDVHGPVKVPTHSGYRYWVTLIDDFSCFKAVYLLKQKSETFAAFKQFKAWAENVTRAKLGTLRDDKGGEYMSSEFEAFCIDHGIQRQHTVRNFPQQNGVAERSNRTMEEGVVSMLYESGMPTAFWGEALATFIHTSNKSFTSALPDKTSHEAFYGSKPDLSRLCVWGCTAYVLIQRDKHPLGSLGSHMEKCVFLVYPQGYKGWKFYNPVTKKVIISERADFDERYFMLQRLSVPHLPPTHPDTLLEMPPVISLLPDLADDVLDTPFHLQKPVHGGDGSTASDLPSAPPMLPPDPSVHPHTPPSTYHSLPPDTPLPATPPARFHLPPPATPHPQRLRCPRNQWLPEQWAAPDRYKLPREPTPAVASSDEEDSCSDDPLDLIQAGAASTAEPTSYRQSQQCSDADLWHTACEEELEAHRLNGTWEIVKLPPGKRVIGSRRFMKVKHNADG